MNNVPLINNLTVNDINTALIAIKKNLVKGANGNEQLQDVDVNVDVNIAQNCTYCAADSTTIKGAELFQGCSIKVLFTSAITGSNTTSPLTINYNNVDITVKVGKNGALADFVAYNTGSGFVYCQAYTTLELLFDGNNFVIMGNPVVISNSDYVINADGSITYNGFTDLVSEIHPAEGITLGDSCNITKHNGVVSIYINFTLANTFTKNDVLFTFSEKLRSRLSYIEVPCFLHAPDTFMGFLRFQFSVLNILPNDQTMSEGTYRFTANYLAYDCTI
jgi:hypothetical protein